MSKITDKEYLRAFVDPVMYPFLLEEYCKNPLGKERLDEDIKLAREKYKEIVGREKRKTTKKHK
jgi:hypothetical protein